jgi:hypothetical protein
MDRACEGDGVREAGLCISRAPYQFYNVTYAENLKLVDSFKPELGSLSKRATVKRFADNLLVMPASLGETISMPRTFWVLGLASVNEMFGRTPQNPIVPVEERRSTVDSLRRVRNRGNGFAC